MASPATSRTFASGCGSVENCNATIASALVGLADLNWAPTFAFPGQLSTAVEWLTIEVPPRYERQGKRKTEIWLLCASGLLPRGHSRRAAR